jgi:hypothetical protein
MRPACCSVGASTFTKAVPRADPIINTIDALVDSTNLKGHIGRIARDPWRHVAAQLS